MFRSNGAVLVLMALVIAGASLLPSTGSAQKGSQAERILTVHEDGVAYRCRVLASWRQPDGTRAYQLQDVKTGKILSIIEAGTGRPLVAGNEAPSTKAIPMRIFHWFDKRTPPPGAPVAPHRVTWEVTPAAAEEMQVAAGNTGPHKVISRVPVGPEQVIWWEEGQSGNAPVMHTAPAAPATPTPTGKFLPATVKNDVDENTPVLTVGGASQRMPNRDNPATAGNTPNKTPGTKNGIQQASHSSPAGSIPSVSPRHIPIGQERIIVWEEGKCPPQSNTQCGPTGRGWFPWARSCPAPACPQSRDTHHATSKNAKSKCAPTFLEVVGLPFRFFGNAPRQVPGNVYPVQSVAAHQQKQTGPKGVVQASGTKHGSQSGVKTAQHTVGAQGYHPSETHLSYRPQHKTTAGSGSFFPSFNLFSRKSTSQTSPTWVAQTNPQSPANRVRKTKTTGEATSPWIAPFAPLFGGLSMPTPGLFRKQNTPLEHMTVAQNPKSLPPRALPPRNATSGIQHAEARTTGNAKNPGTQQANWNQKQYPYGTKGVAQATFSPSNTQPNATRTTQTGSSSTGKVIRPPARTPQARTPQLQTAQGTSGFRPRTVFQRLFGKESNTPATTTAQAKNSFPHRYTVTPRKNTKGASTATNPLSPISSSLAKVNPPSRPTAPQQTQVAKGKEPQRFPLAQPTANNAKTTSSPYGSHKSGTPSYLEKLRQQRPGSTTSVASSSPAKQPRTAFESATQSLKKSWPWYRKPEEPSKLAKATPRTQPSTYGKSPYGKSPYGKSPYSPTASKVNERPRPWTPAALASKSPTLPGRTPGRTPATAGKNNSKDNPNVFERMMQTAQARWPWYRSPKSASESPATQIAKSRLPFNPIQQASHSKNPGAGNAIQQAGLSGKNGKNPGGIRQADLNLRPKAPNPLQTAQGQQKSPFWNRLFGKKQPEPTRTAQNTPRPSVVPGRTPFSTSTGSRSGTPTGTPMVPRTATPSTTNNQPPVLPSTPNAPSLPNAEPVRPAPRPTAIANSGVPSLPVPLVVTQNSTIGSNGKLMLPELPTAVKPKQTTVAQGPAPISPAIPLQIGDPMAGSPVVGSTKSEPVSPPDFLPPSLPTPPTTTPVQTAEIPKFVAPPARSNGVAARPTMQWPPRGQDVAANQPNSVFKRFNQERIDRPDTGSIALQNRIRNLFTPSNASEVAQVTPPSLPASTLPRITQLPGSIVPANGTSSNNVAANNVPQSVTPIPTTLPAQPQEVVQAQAATPATPTTPQPRIAAKPRSVFEASPAPKAPPRPGWAALKALFQRRPGSTGTQVASTGSSSNDSKTPLQQVGMTTAAKSTSLGSGMPEITAPQPRSLVRQPSKSGGLWEKMMARFRSDPKETPKASTTQVASNTRPGTPAKTDPTSLPFSTAHPLEGEGSLPSIARQKPNKIALPSQVPAVQPKTEPEEKVRMFANAGERKKSNWRSMWGKDKSEGVQTASTAGNNAEYHTPRSAVQNSSEDILLNPSKFDPQLKQGPRVASNSSFLNRNPRFVPRKPYRPSATENSHEDKTPGDVTPGEVPQGDVHQGGIQQTAHQQPNGMIPAGAQSFLASRNGLVTPVSYVPVPIVTIPNRTRPPTPPAPEIPQPPPANEFVNAFTPPMSKEQLEQIAMQQKMQDQMMGNFRPSMVNPAMLAQAYAQNPYLANPQLMMHGVQHYQQLPPQHQAMVQQAIWIQQQTLMQQQQSVMQTQTAMNHSHVQYPSRYTGPQPPNPNGMSQASYRQPGYYQPQPGYPQQGYPQPGMPGQVQQVGYQQAQNTQANAELAKLIQVLAESPYPAQREWAANSLSTFDWRHNPHVVQVLTQAARQDPAATVRANCVYSLSRMNAAVEPVAATFMALQSDPDPRVRHEVQQAYQRMAPVHN